MIVHLRENFKIQSFSPFKICFVNYAAKELPSAQLEENSDLANGGVVKGGSSIVHENGKKPEEADDQDVGMSHFEVIDEVDDANVASALIDDNKEDSEENLMEAYDEDDDDDVVPLAKLKKNITKPSTAVHWKLKHDKLMVKYQKNKKLLKFFKPLLCNKCDAKFLSSTNAKRHFENAHTDYLKLECIVQGCNYRCNRMDHVSLIGM